MIFMSKIANSKIDSESKSYEHSIPHMLFLAIAYMFFMYPISYFGFGDGISINYSFLLMPIISFAYYGFDGITKKVWIHCSIFVSIFVLSMLFGRGGVEGHEFRQFMSFAAFMALFGMVFCNKNFISLKSFKAALIGISVVLSFVAISKYYDLCIINENCIELKSAVGSQRYGFLYILAIWVLAYYNATSIFRKVIQYALLTTITIGLYLTYSRSSLIALLLTIVVYIVVRASKNCKKSISVDVAILYVVIFSMGLTYGVDSIRDVYFLSGVPKNITEEIVNPNASAGYRLVMWSDIVVYILQHPMLGAGFNGVWVLSEGVSGSAHSQYLDVLFRVGVIGFAVYMSILYAIVIKLWRLDGALFLGFVGVLFVGLFHETFKLSHGAFVFAYLYRLLLVEGRS